MGSPESSTTTLIKALRCIAEDIQDPEGTTKAAIREAAGRMEMLYDGNIFLAALERSPFDLSLCKGCGNLVVCIPDGLPFCNDCGDET